VDVPCLVQRLLAVDRGRCQLFDVVLFLTVGRFNYVVGRVVRQRAVQPDGRQERHQLVGGALVHAVPLRQYVHMVEQLEHAGTWLVDGAHDGATLVRKPTQQLQAVGAGNVVQATIYAKTIPRQVLCHSAFKR